MNHTKIINTDNNTDSSEKNTTNSNWTKRLAATIAVLLTWGSLNTTFDIEKDTSGQENIVEERPSTKKYGGIILNKTNEYKRIPGVEKTLTDTLGKVTYKNALVTPQKGTPYNTTHTETYYTDRCKSFPISNIERRVRKILNEDRKRKNLPNIPETQPVIQYAIDGTIRDIHGYIIVAADLQKYPRGTLIMTTLGPGRVYDTGSFSSNNIDIYTHRSTQEELNAQQKIKGN